MQSTGRFFSSCPVCHSARFKKTFTNKWKKSSFIICKNCNLIFQNPQENLAQTMARYDQDYFDYEVANQENFFNLIKLTLDDFSIIDTLPTGASVLEVGSATGLFLRYMNSRGFNTTGVEVCKQSVDYGRKAYGVNLIHGRLEEQQFNTGGFDFIHFSHLIEHLNNPVEFLTEIYRILKPGGYTMITTPNSSGVFAKYYRESWRCIVDDHLFIFNTTNLHMLLERLGFTVTAYKTWGGIPAGTVFKSVKKIVDRFVKKYNLGDVMCYLVKK